MGRKRANNGSGTIARHKGRQKEYQVLFFVDGKRKSGGYYKTHAEASKVLRDLATTVDKGEYIEPQKMLVSEWLQIWVESSKIVASSKKRISEGLFSLRFFESGGHYERCSFPGSQKDQ